MSNQKGNVLFIILVAIALFGALSFAVTQSTGGKVEALTDEKAELIAGVILSYATTIKAAVQRLRYSGVAEADLCFDIDEYPGGNASFEHAACADVRNRVFHPNGGGGVYKSADDLWLDPNAASFAWTFNGGVNIDGVGTDAVELVWQQNGITESVCKAINVRLGVVNGMAADVPEENNSAPSGGNVYAGSFGTTLTNNIGDDGTGLSGHTAFCRNQSAVPIFQFNQVLLIR